MDEKLKMIYSRRSIRKYQERPVEKEKLVELVKAGMSAPTARNNQPWEMVVVDDPQVMEQFRTRLQNGRYNAPAAIVVCYNPQVSLQPSADRFWVQDCSIASENILVAAAGLGLGTVWLGTHPSEDSVAIVKEIVNLPEHVTPLTVLYVGYPDEVKEAHTKYEERRVHWQTYSA